MKRKCCVIGLILAVLLSAGLAAGRLFRQKTETSQELTAQKEILLQDYTCASLRKHLAREIDRNQNGALSQRERERVISLELSYTDSNSLDFQQLSDFPNLRELTVKIGNRTGDVVLEKIPHVTKLTVYSSKKKKKRSVVIRNIEQLEYLHLGLYHVPRVTIEKCDALVDINCHTNASVVRVRDLESLESIMLTAEKLKSFQHENVNNLQDLIVSYAYRIKEIDLSGLDKLERFDWCGGNLEKIIWGKKDHLLDVYISDNNFQGVLDLDQDIPESVSDIDCRKNKITEIVGKKKKYIYSLHCQNNKLRKIDLSNTELCLIDARGNKNVWVYLRSRQDLGGETYGYWFDKSAKVHYKYSKSAKLPHKYY